MGYRDIVIVNINASSEYTSSSGPQTGMTTSHVLLNDSIPGCDRELTWSSGNGTFSVSVPTDAHGGTGAKIQPGTVFYFGVPT